MSEADRNRLDKISYCKGAYDRGKKGRLGLGIPSYLFLLEWPFSQVGLLLAFVAMAFAIEGEKNFNRSASSGASAGNCFEKFPCPRRVGNKALISFGGDDIVRPRSLDALSANFPFSFFHLCYAILL
jgi:hypothetical protein